MKDNTKRLIRKAENLTDVVKTTEWLCEVIACYDTSLEETLKRVLRIYKNQLHAVSRGYDVTPPNIGRVQPELAVKLRKTVEKFGYETDEAFKLKLFCFQAEQLGFSFNYGLFIW